MSYLQQQQKKMENITLPRTFINRISPRNYRRHYNILYHTRQTQTNEPFFISF